eukprot:GHVP01006179.1.p1 GENE.GHVP01006179.1~~GHVP01006179.1.p1  ORF type:complete len:700 (-),score=130.95 GHVP01006179.1:2018-4117(-)
MLWILCFFFLFVSAGSQVASGKLCAFGDVNGDGLQEAIVLTSEGDQDVLEDGKSFRQFEVLDIKEFNPILTVQFQSHQVADILTYDITDTGTDDIMLVVSKPHEIHSDVKMLGFILLEFNKTSEEFDELWSTDGFISVSEPLFIDLFGDSTPSLTSERLRCTTDHNESETRPLITSLMTFFPSSFPARRRLSWLPSWLWPFGSSSSSPDLTTTPLPPPTLQEAGPPPSSLEDCKLERKVWIYRRHEEDPVFTEHPFQDVVGANNFQEDTAKYDALAPRHGSAFVDLDGDCSADVFLEVQNNTLVEGSSSFELWYSSPNGYKLETNYKNKINFTGKLKTSPTFADFNNDATLDIIVGIENDDSSNSLVVVWNQQLPICPVITSFWTVEDSRTNCKPSTEICVSGLSNFTTEEFPITNESGTKWNFFSTEIKGGLQVVDWDRDGWQDILGIVIDDGASESYITLFKNVPSLTGRKLVKDNTLVVKSTVIQYISKFILLDRKPKNNTFFISGYNKASEWMTERIDVLQEVKDAMLIQTAARETNNSVGVGRLTLGASFVVAAAETDGRWTFRKAAQQYRHAYGQLATSHVEIGLGRSTNFVESLVVGVPAVTDGERNWRSWYREWQSLIPNSAATASVRHHDEPQKWRMQLSLQKSQHLRDMTFVVCGMLAALGTAICVFDHFEKKEDLTDERKFRSNFVRL